MQNLKEKLTHYISKDRQIKEIKEKSYEISEIEDEIKFHLFKKYGIKNIDFQIFKNKNKIEINLSFLKIFDKK